MSSKNNDEFTGLFMVIGLIGGMVYVAVLAVGFLVILGIAVVTLVFTILSLIAWNRPVRAFGQVIMPEEARRFIKRGLHGLSVARLRRLRGLRNAAHGLLVEGQP